MEKEKMLKLMRYWLFGTFVIVFAALVTYVGLFADRNVWLAITASFPIWGLTGVLCAIIYFVYKWILNRRENKA